MRFLVDESTGVAVAEFLRGQGHDAVAVAEITPQAVDQNILRSALAEQRIIITNDKDFGDLVFRSGMEHVGVILLRLRDESAAQRVAVVQRLLANHASDLNGNFVVATDFLTRIRKVKDATSEPEVKES